MKGGQTDWNPEGEADSHFSICVSICKLVLTWRQRLFTFQMDGLPRTGGHHGSIGATDRYRRLSDFDHGI